MNSFNPNDWYWKIGDAGDIYSSKRNTYVNSSDSNYQAWLINGGFAPPIQTEAEVWYYTKDVLPSWLWDGTTFSQPAVGAYTTTQLKAYAQLVRENTANGGMTAEGIPILTDDFTRTRISNARTAAEADAAYTTTILGSNGVLYPVNATQVIAISDDVIAFGTNLANTYAMVHNEIDSGQITTLAEIDSAFAAVTKSIKDGSKNHYRGVAA
jgi:maltose-binding protein MalE